MVVIVPVDADVNEAKHIRKQHRQQRVQRGKPCPMRHLNFQHHNRNDNGKDAVAERRHPFFTHSLYP